MNVLNTVNYEELAARMVDMEKNGVQVKISDDCDACYKPCVGIIACSDFDSFDIKKLESIFNSINSDHLKNRAIASTPMTTVRKESFTIPIRQIVYTDEVPKAKNNKSVFKWCILPVYKLMSIDGISDIDSLNAMLSVILFDPCKLYKGIVRGESIDLNSHKNVTEEDFGMNISKADAITTIGSFVIYRNILHFTKNNLKNSIKDVKQILDLYYSADHDVVDNFNDNCELCGIPVGEFGVVQNTQLYCIFCGAVSKSTYVIKLPKSRQELYAACPGYKNVSRMIDLHAEKISKIKGAYKLVDSVSKKCKYIMMSSSIGEYFVSPHLSCKDALIYKKLTIYDLDSN